LLCPMGLTLLCNCLFFPLPFPIGSFLMNWCPHTVTKTVTCQVQNGTILQRVYQTCRWPQGCTGGSYRTVVRPSYKVVYRTVTSLEWKCCPGFSGAACEEGNFMYLAPGLEMPLLLTDLFIISQDFPRENIENCFSCSQKEIKWLVSAVQRNF
uniref:EMI domain-containing protein n=1 Tax=Amphiprion percula TaxID=161767 RepID=A0A3P8U5M5_AMPPE